MQPFHQLLDRIRWDAEFGAATFEIGYYDRVEDQIVRVRLDMSGAGQHQPDALTMTDEEGHTVDVPYHRVRRVWRDGELIWRRDPG